MQTVAPQSFPGPLFRDPQSGQAFLDYGPDPAVALYCDEVEATVLPHGTQIRNVGTSVSTVLADLDFETYSEAGCYLDQSVTPNKWRIIPGAPKGCTSGLAAVGTVNYASHPSTELLSLAYDLKDGGGARLWLPFMPPPQDLFEYIQRGGLVAAWNSQFEFWVWLKVCHERMGWPELPFWQLRDDMAKAQAFGLPGALANAGDALDVDQKKDKDGTRLLNKFSKPQQPLKSKPDRLRIRPEEDPEDVAKLYGYNVQDIRSEASIAALVPDLSPEELEVWLYDQAINVRGVGIDVQAVHSLLAIVEQAQARGRAELQQLTQGVIKTESEATAIKNWVCGRGTVIYSLDEDAVAEALERQDLPVDVRRVLEIRRDLASAAVKKLFAMKLKTSAQGRMHGVFMYCGAQKTGRWAGRDIQPQNFPSAGLDVSRCRNCGGVKSRKLETCHHCGDFVQGGDPAEWGDDAVAAVLATVATGSLDLVEQLWGPALSVVSACLRGMLCAAPGNDLICSDFSAIEAVVLAMLSRCQWRIDVFRTHGKIYEMSAAKISGIPFEEILAHKEQTGDHHPLRKKVGKVAELASGYQGWIGAWKNFGADKFMSEPEMKQNILKWRDDSPEIVEFWGGQYRRTGYRQTTPELYGVEGCAVAAIMNPGQVFQHNDLQFGVKDNVLYIRLPSGRCLTYHKPQLHDDVDPLGVPIKRITYWGVCPTSKKWVLRDTYGGRLTENIVQAAARDIQAHSIVQLEKAGYSVVLHVHDEIVSEQLAGTGTVEHFEQIMSTMPAWAADWPVRAKGGWRGLRYKKD